MEPKIYVACLAAYNNGILHGAYIDATLHPDDMLDLIGEMLEKSPIEGAEEWEIHDYDGFDCIRIDRWEDLQQVHDIACFLVEHEELGTELLKKFGGNVEEAKQLMDEKHIGEFDSLEDYAEQFTNDCYNLPEFIAYYVDFKDMGRDLADDLIKIELDGCVHLFHKE
jgi:antirestriction protein